MLLLLNHYGYEVKEEFDNIYQKYDNSIFVNQVGLELYSNNPFKSGKYIEKLKEIYGEDIPVRYMAMDILSNFPSPDGLEAIREICIARCTG